LYSIESVRASAPDLPSLTRSKLTTTLNDLDTLANAFEAIVRGGLETIYATQVRNKLSPVLAQISKDLAGEMSESSLLRIIPVLDRVFSATPLDRLADENRVSMLLLVSREIASHLEKAIVSAKWTGLRVSVFERELRRLSAYLADLTELQAKELLLQATQMLSILSNDSRAEAIAYIEEAKKTACCHLSDADISGLLACRIDWSQDGGDCAINN
jgi:hypothetical protein